MKKNSFKIVLLLSCVFELSCITAPFSERLSEAAISIINKDIVYEKLIGLCKKLEEGNYNLDKKEIPLLRFIANRKIPITFDNTNEVIPKFTFRKVNKRYVVKENK